MHAPLPRRASELAVGSRGGGGLTGLSTHQGDAAVLRHVREQARPATPYHQLVSPAGVMGSGADSVMSLVWGCHSAALTDTDLVFDIGRALVIWRESCCHT